MALAALLCSTALAAQATTPPASNPGPGALSLPNADPFPSTYTPSPSRPTVIRNVNIFTGAGPLIRNGAVLLVDGKEWVVPGGVASVGDGMGGMTALLVVVKP